jgi:hypothetical protein
MKFPLCEKDLIPDHPRSDDFVKFVEAIEAFLPPPYDILETGTMREGDFDSTLLFDQFVNFHGGHVKTFDIDPATGRRAVQLCTGKVRIVTGDSIDGLYKSRREQQTFNVAWLDSYDVLWLEPHKSALHHLMELTAALPLLRRPCVIAVDDNKVMQNLRTGKGKYVYEFMTAIHAKPVVLNYLYAWVVE